MALLPARSPPTCRYIDLVLCVEVLLKHPLSLPLLFALDVLKPQPPLVVALVFGSNWKVGFLPLYSSVWHVRGDGTAPSQERRLLLKLLCSTTRIDFAAFFGGEIQENEGFTLQSRRFTACCDQSRMIQLHNRRHTGFEELFLLLDNSPIAAVSWV